MARRRKLLLAGLFVIVLAAGGVALARMLTHRENERCPVPDAKLCTLASRLEVSLQNHELDAVLESTRGKPCDYEPRRTDCPSTVDLYYFPADWGCPLNTQRCYGGDGANVFPEVHRANLESWLDLFVPVRLHGVGLREDRSPAALLFTTDGMTDERRPQPSILFVLVEEAGEYLVGQKISLPRRLALNPEVGGNLLWIDWPR